MSAPERESSAAAVARHATATAKEHVSVEEAVALSSELARRVRAAGHAPQVVVGVAVGGLLPARVVADELGLPLAVVTVRRGGSLVKERLARVPGLVRLAEAWLAAPPLVRWPLAAAVRLADRAFRLERLPAREWPETVLLVDDAQQTGATAARAEALLAEGGARRVVRAVLTWSPEGGRSRSPDLHIGRRLQHYPWSANSPHRDAWRAWLAARGLEAR